MPDAIQNPGPAQRKLQRRNGHDNLQLRMLGDNINLERFQWNELADILEGRTAGDLEMREELIKRIRRLVWVESDAGKRG